MASSAAIQQLPLVCPGHNRGVVELNYSATTPDGVFFISACLDGKPMLRDGVSGDWIGTFDGHKGAVWSAAITPDATLAATGAADFTARLWDALTGDALAVLPQNHICKSVAFSSTADRLLTAGAMAAISVYDVALGEAPPLSTLVDGGAAEGAKPPGVKFVRYVGDSPHQVVSASNSPRDAFLCTWDVRSGQAPTGRIELTAGVRSAELCADGTTLVVVTDDAKVHVLDATSGKVLREPLQVAEATESASLQLPGRGRLVTGGRDLEVHAYDYETGAELESLRGHHGPVWVVRHAPDGETFASGSDDATVRIWRSNPQPNCGAAAGGATNGGS